MREMIAIACVLAMISGGAQAQVPGARATAPQKPHASMQKKKATAKRPNPAVAVAPAAKPVPAQVAPPVPATLMNSAPVNPNVTLANGLLTIDAPNSTLSDVLRGVHNVTGAEIEGASPSERVAVRLGPGEPRQVVAALLEGTPYNYLILGSLEKPDAVTRIVLTQSTEGASAQSGPAPRPQPATPQPPANEVPDSSPADDVTTPPPAETQAEQPPTQPDQNAPKTPDQLFRQLLPGQSAPPAAQPQP